MGTTARPFCGHVRMAASHLFWSHCFVQLMDCSCLSMFSPALNCSGESDGCVSSAGACASTTGTSISPCSASTLTQPQCRECACKEFKATEARAEVLYKGVHLGWLACQICLITFLEDHIYVCKDGRRCEVHWRQSVHIVNKFAHHHPRCHRHRQDR